MLNYQRVAQTKIMALLFLCSVATHFSNVGLLGTLADSRKHQGHSGGLHVSLSDRRTYQLLSDLGLQHAGALRLRVDELQAQRPVGPQGSWTEKKHHRNGYGYGGYGIMVADLVMVVMMDQNPSYWFRGA